MDVFVEPAYRRVASEEGSYTAADGYNVLVDIQCEDGICERHVYVGKERGTEGYRFSTEVAAEAFAKRVSAVGRIVLELWFHVSCHDPNELPDYALHPARPEYN